MDQDTGVVGTWKSLQFYCLSNSFDLEDLGFTPLALPSPICSRKTVGSKQWHFLENVGEVLICLIRPWLWVVRLISVQAALSLQTVEFSACGWF